MKRQVTLLALLCALVGGACSDENNYFETTELFYDGTTFHSEDVKATRIVAVGEIFDNIARNPGIAADLISSGQSLLMKNYQELLPLKGPDFEEDRSLARGVALSALFESFARQPEAYDELDRAAALFLGTFDASLFPEGSGRGRGEAVAGLLDAVARQPEAADDLDALATTYLGVYSSEFPVYVMNYARAVASPGLTAAIARQPEMTETLNRFAKKYLGNQ